jgi:hypothetical protein
MKVASDAIRNLKIFANENHFTEAGMYTGVHDPLLRKKLNSQLNSTIQNFIEAVENRATREQYIELLRNSIANFDRIALDTEDAEQVALNFERIMDCVGLESSDGVLNEWMYGFDPR